MEEDSGGEPSALTIAEDVCDVIEEASNESSAPEKESSLKSSVPVGEKLEGQVPPPLSNGNDDHTVNQDLNDDEDSESGSDDETSDSESNQENAGIKSGTKIPDKDNSDNAVVPPLKLSAAILNAKKKANISSIQESGHGKETEDNPPNFLYPDAQPSSEDSLGASEGNDAIPSSASNSVIVEKQPSCATNSFLFTALNSSLDKDSSPKSSPIKEKSSPVKDMSASPATPAPQTSTTPAVSVSTAPSTTSTGTISTAPNTTSAGTITTAPATTPGSASTSTPGRKKGWYNSYTLVYLVFKLYHVFTPLDLLL